MSTDRDALFRWFLEDGVALVEVLGQELNQPAFAVELGAELQALLDTKAADRMLLDFHNTQYMSSTSFAMLLQFARAAEAAGVKVALCSMKPVVLMGANILSLDQLIPIFNDRATGLAVLRA